MSEYARNENGKSPGEQEPQLFSFNRQAEQESEDTLLGGLDLVRVYYILKQNVVWLVLLPMLCLLGGYVYLRYTKPLFESSSSIKLEIEQKANVLGLNGVSTNEDLSANLSGEIELIRSKLIYDEVIRRMDIGVSYYTYGNILDEERYRNAPFQVTYERKNFTAYDQPFDVTMLNDQQYSLGYQVNGTEQNGTYSFGQVVRTDGFSFVIDTTSFYSPDLNGKKFYFVVNSPVALSNYLASNMRVDVLNPVANIIGVAFKDHTPAKAHDIVNTIDSVYLDKTLELKNKANKQKIGFLEDQLRVTEDSLERYESQQEKFIVRNKTADVKADVSKYVTTIEELIKQRTELEGQLSLLRNLRQRWIRKDDLRSFIPSVPLLDDAQLATLTQEINRLQQERALALTSSKATTSAVRSKDKAIEIARQNITGLITQDEQLLRGKIGQVNARIREFEGTFTGLPAKGTEYTKIQRFKDLYEKYYLLIMDRKAELGIAEAGTVPEFVILSPASQPTQSIFPNRIMVYGASGAAGLLLSLMLLTMRYLLHDTVSNQRELERMTDAPILGAIPTYNRESMDVSRLIVHKNPKASISEAMRSIRTNLEFVFPSGKNKRIITVTSTVSGEGKTFVALNLSGIIALSDARVVLIDLDMRKPKVNLAFDEENNSGVSTILIGKHSVKECIRQTPIDTLDFIAAGPTPPNPSELILRPEFDNFLKELHKLYDVIVIDTPPVGLVTDGILVMKKADLPIYVVRADYSKRYFVRNINKLIRNNNFTRLSVILNAFKHLSQYGYGYDYSYYQGYSDEEKPEGKGISKIKGLLAKTKMISFFKKFSREESSEVATMPLVADMHSHYLFGLDDGAATLADSLALIQKLSEAGYKKLIATPHIMGDFYKNTPAGINARLQEVKTAVQEKGLASGIAGHAEYYLDEWFVNKLRREEQLLTFGGRYLLFETSYINQPAQLQEAIFLMQAQGYKPVMAHPERYLYLQENFNKLIELYETGVMMQVNINSVAGYYSLPAQLLAERLIDYKMVRFAGTDVHNLKHIKVLQSARTKKYYAKLLNNDLLNKSL